MVLKGRRCALAALLLTLATPALAQDPPPEGLRAAARSFALPMEVEHDFGAANGEATFLRFLPVWSLPLNDDWRIINLDLITVAEAPGGVPGRPGNPNPTLGERAFGLSDLLHTSFLTPEGQASKGGRPSCSCGLREYGVPYDSVHKPRHTKEAKR